MCDSNQGTTVGPYINSLAEITLHILYITSFKASKYSRLSLIKKIRILKKTPEYVKHGGNSWSIFPLLNNPPKKMYLKSNESLWNILFSKDPVVFVFPVVVSALVLLYVLQDVASLSLILNINFSTPNHL